MTGTPDFDRRLNDWLQDGPGRAPERSIAAALDHARVNPRRRDPLAALRRDPMGSARFGSGMRALPLVAALGLLLVAVVAVATVGGVFNRQPVVVPPIESPSVSPAPATPSPAPTASPSPAIVRVDLLANDGRVLSTIEIVDESGTLVRAGTGQPGEGGSQSTPDKADVENDATDPTTVVLTWTGLFDSDDRRLTIAPDGRTMTIEVAPGQGDLLPVDRQLILTFSGPVPNAEVDATIVEVAR